MSGLTQKDLNILETYTRLGNRELYFNYLAHLHGNDGYGLLALGVVRNDSTPGRTANRHAQDYGREHNHRSLSEREWQGFGVDLMRQDFAARQEWMKRDPSKALNLPVRDVQKAHRAAFKHVGIDADAWTPNRLIDEARNRGGEARAEEVWGHMLDNSGRGSLRAGISSVDIARNFADKLEGLQYLGRLGIARLSSDADLPTTNPDRIGRSDDYYEFDARAKSWTHMQSTPDDLPSQRWQREVVSEAELVRSLDDTRALRLERRQMRTQFHPDDPYRSIITSPTLISEQPALAPAPLRTASASAPHPHPSLHQELRSLLPDQTSEDRLAQITTEARLGGVRPGYISAIRATEDSLFIIGQGMGERARIDLTQPPPALEHSVQSAQLQIGQQAIQSQQIAQQVQQQAPGLAR